jgi:multisubunit Na+/H+ antiporter MnhE subunit
VARRKRSARRRGSPLRRQERALETPLERLVFGLTWLAIGIGLWMLLVFKTEPAEMVAGAVATALAATGAELVRLSGYAPFSPELRWWRALALLPREVLVDTWRMLWLLVLHFGRGKPIEGRFRIVHFEASAGHEPRKQARRAVATWLGGVSPNTYVLGFDERRDAAVLHQLVPTEPPPEIDPSA